MAMVRHYIANRCRQQRWHESCSVFVRAALSLRRLHKTWCKIFRWQVYGLHIPPLQPVVLPPPSALTRVGVTKVLRNRTAAATTSSTRFTVISFFLLRVGP